MMTRDKQIGMAIKKLSNNYTRFFNRIRREVHDNINSPNMVSRLQGWIIEYLFRETRHRDVFLKDIEREFNIRRSTACNVISRMEANGLVIRVLHAEDARFKAIKLTGKAFTDHLEARRDFPMAGKTAVKGLSKEELQIFLAVCEKISLNLS